MIYTEHSTGIGVSVSLIVGVIVFRVWCASGHMGKLCRVTTLQPSIAETIKLNFVDIKLP
jgi:hypothetical protein